MCERRLLAPVNPAGCAMFTGKHRPDTGLQVRMG